MKSLKAFTLIELLAGFAIGTVMILMIGAVLSIGTVSHQKLRNEGGLFSDLSYAFRSLRNRVREAAVISYDASATFPWEGPRLIAGDTSAQGAFGILNTGGDRSFVYVPDKNDVSQKDVLLTVPNQEDNNLSFYFYQVDNSIRAYLWGTRDKIPFDFSSSIMKRIQNEQ